MANFEGTTGTKPRPTKELRGAYVWENLSNDLE